MNSNNLLNHLIFRPDSMAAKALNITRFQLPEQTKLCIWRSLVTLEFPENGCLKSVEREFNVASSGSKEILVTKVEQSLEVLLYIQILVCGSDEWGADCAGCCHCAQGAACHNVTGACPAQVGCSDCWTGDTCQQRRKS